MAVDVHKLGSATILEGDVRESLATLPADHFHCVVTSPPYWALRSYLSKDHSLKSLELGSEPTPEAYIDKMVAVFRDVRRVLRPDGLCWVDIGDCYAHASTPGGAAPVGERRGRKTDASRRDEMGGNLAPGLKSGDMCLIPSRLALALQADGWYVRQIVIFSKPSPMPESLSGTRWERCRVKVAPKNVNTGKKGNNGHGAQQNGEFVSQATWQPCPGCDKCRATGGYVLRRGSWRCTTAHEYVLMLAKSPSYFSDQEAVKEEAIHDGRVVTVTAKGFAGQAAGIGEHGSGNAVVGAHVEVHGRNPRSVWTIGPEPLSEPHYAAFPSALPEKCINASTSAKGCCPVCGAQVARIVDSVSLKRERPNDITKRTGEDGTGNHCGNTVAGVESRTIGWRPTCDHAEAANPVPCRVLDPFGGSGTTALQSLRMGREATLCELNPDYVAMATRRIRAEFGLFTEVA